NEADTGAYLWPGSGDHSSQGFVEVRRLQDLELPFQVDVTYASLDRDYLSGIQSGQILEATHVQEPVTIGVPLTLTDLAARAGAEAQLYRLWTEREQFTVSLP